jgi:protein-tyrosine-phosphatase
MRLLFVCSGNTCRSAMAAAIARSRGAARGAADVHVESAGTAAATGDPAMPEAIAAARRHGVALEDHRTKALTRELVESADHVLVMKPEHAQRVQELVPAALVTCLEIEDPIGRGEVAYEEAWQQLDERIAAFLGGI